MLTGLNNATVVSDLDWNFSWVLGGLVHDLFGHDVFFTLADHVVIYEARFVALGHLRLSQKGGHVIGKLLFLIESKLAYWTA